MEGIGDPTQNLGRPSGEAAATAPVARTRTLAVLGVSVIAAALVASAADVAPIAAPLALAIGATVALTVLTDGPRARTGPFTAAACAVFALVRLLGTTDGAVLTVAAETLALAAVSVGLGRPRVGEVGTRPDRSGTRRPSRSGPPSGGDPETGDAVVRHAFQRELVRSRRHDRPLSVVVVEPRPVPAAEGPSAPGGDRPVRREAERRRSARRSLAVAASQDVRRIDSVWRHGSKGLVLICPETPCSGAETTAARLARSMDLRLGVRVVWGAASYPEDGASFDELVGVAERRRSTALTAPSRGTTSTEGTK